MHSYLGQKSPDCFFYSEESIKFPTHKEILSQTPFMQEILADNECCDDIEIILPCQSVELDCLIRFLHGDEIFAQEKCSVIQVYENLTKLLGFNDDQLIIEDLTAFEPEINLSEAGAGVFPWCDEK